MALRKFGNSCSCDFPADRLLWRCIVNLCHTCSVWLEIYLIKVSNEKFSAAQCRAADEVYECVEFFFISVASQTVRFVL